MRIHQSTRHSTRIVALASLGLAVPALACPPEDPVATGPSQQQFVVSCIKGAAVPRDIDLAICLDTSGSMQGLIDAARIKLWDIVNDLAKANPTPHLRVALLTYGNNGHAAENGWVRLDAPLTEDLDLISQKLFALTTNGGTELVGRVVDAATKQLSWSASAGALKMIVVAGNESANQDQQMPFRAVCRESLARGIVVNSIYCGPFADHMAPEWREVAILAAGHFAAIDHQHGTVVVTTPFDDALVSLSASLNETYVPFGVHGAAAWGNQQQQDGNAASLSTAVAAQRCATKAGDLYSNGSWDLVDACKDKEFKLESVMAEQLPEAMRSMTLEQRRSFVDQQAAQREALQRRVAELDAQRQEFVAAEMKRIATKGDDSFDAAMRAAIRAQATGKGFAFPPDC